MPKTKPQRSGAIRIGVLTSGGDAPGMNACIRAIAKGALTIQSSRVVKVIGIVDGIAGLVAPEPHEPHHFDELTSGRVSNIIEVSGTILGTSRENEIVGQFNQSELEDLLQSLDLGRPMPIDFVLETVGMQGFVESVLGHPDVRERIADRVRRNLESQDIHGLILIGGDQTCVAAAELYRNFELPLLVVPATIDNDVASTDESFGWDSAVEAAVQSVDSVRATASSHSRLFIVQVMGRSQGHIAVEVALASGAEEVLVPEHGPYSPADLKELADRLLAARARGRRSALILVAEGVELVDSAGQSLGSDLPIAHALGTCIAQAIVERGRPGWETRVHVVGHVQRGTRPTHRSRNLASRMGLAALDEMVRVLTGGINSPPRLVATAHDALVFHQIEGSMARDERESVLRRVEQVSRLAY